MKAIAGLLLSVFVLQAQAFSQQNKINVAAEPAWITKVPKTTVTPNLEDVEDGYWYEGSESQLSVPHQSKYIKERIGILTQAGLQSASEVSVNFDPSYQKLIFHTLNIIRGNQTIQCLHPKKFKIIQRESDLDKHLYDGSLTAFMLIEDVRVGDVIEYSYSLQGFNPLFTKIATTLDFQYSVPIGYIFYKILMPANRPLQFKNVQLVPKPIISTAGDITTYEWTTSNIPALHLPSNLPNPGSYYPTVLVSEYRTWKDVVDWAVPLYASHQKDVKQIQKKANEIKNSAVSKEEQVLAAIRFVQDEIRYMGIETGIHGHQPHSAEKVMRQRFGDCKDKANLLRQLLGFLNVDANVVLINTELKRGVYELLPSPFAFDHVTVTFELDGKRYWIDPTINGQRGRLQHISFPNYEVALIVRPGNTNLTPVPLQNPGTVSVHEKFTIPDISGKAKLVVTSTYSGERADAVRDYFTTTSQYEIRKKYESFYQSNLERLKIDSLSFREEPETGAFITYEYYTVKDAWKIKDGKRSFETQPYVINGVLEKPKEDNRSGNYALAYPMHYVETVEVSLPEDWGFSGEKIEVKNANYSYLAKVSGKDGHYILQYEYKTFKDHITPTEVSRFLKDYESVEQWYGYSFYEHANDQQLSVASRLSETDDSQNLYPKLYLLVGLCAGITYLIRRKTSN